MDTTAKTAFIAFGGNLGDPIKTLQAALPMLGDAVGDVELLSSLYETKALTLNGSTQPNYINAVIAVSTTLGPEQVLAELLRIEKELGRDRSADKRWEPRTIDLDLLFVDDVCQKTDALTLPHPEISKRDFVLRPLLEIAPEFEHPVSKRSIAELYRLVEDEGLEQFVLRTFPVPAPER